MKQILKSILITAILSLAVIYVNAQQKEASIYTTRKTGFYENKGQITDQNGKPNSAVKFQLCSPGLNVQLRQTGFSYDTYTDSFYNDDSRFKAFGTGRQKQLPKNYVRRFHRVDIELQGCNRDAGIVGEEISEASFNYLAAGSQGALNVHSYQKVIYKNIYPEIDLEFSTNQPGNKGISKSGVEYNFIVHPGAKIANIKLEYKGANDINFNKSNLTVKVNAGDFTETIPSSYLATNKQPVSVNYTDLGNHVYGFALPSKNKSFNSDLVIDPTPNLVWGTYYGGTGDDYGMAIAIGPGGYVYISGYTNSSSGIATSGSYLSSIVGYDDAFAAKFNPAGTSLIWATYYGGNGTSYYWIPVYTFSWGIAVDTAGYVYLTGQTYSDNGIATTGAYQTSGTDGGGDCDAFIAKFSPNGTSLIWGTYFGGPGDDGADCIALDASGNIIIAGGTQYGGSGMTTSGSYQPGFGGGNGDGFIAKFNPSGTSLLWGTYFGGTGSDGITGMVLDRDNNIYATGGTQYGATDMVTTGAYQTSYSSTFVAKFNSSASSLLWGTYYGNGNESASGIAIDTARNVYITGSTESTSGIATAGAYQTGLSGGYDAFVAKFNSTGSSLLWGTYYGGTGTEVDCSILLDAANNVYISGFTQSTTGISTTNAYQPSFSGSSWDAFLAKFNSTGTNLLWGTYFGSSNGDITGEYSRNIAFDPANNLYLTGNTNSTSGLSTSGVYQTSLSGGVDAFIAKFDSVLTPPPTVISGSSSVCTGSSITLSNGTAGGAWTSGNTAVATIVSGTGLLTGIAAGTTIITYSVSGSIATTTITVNASPSITLDTVTSICSGDTTAFLPYTTTSNSPTTYSISWGTTAITAGFSNVTGSTLPSGSGTWNYIAPMPYGRTEVVAAPFGNNIYLIGGNQGTSSWCSSDLQVYNTSTNAWSIDASMPGCRKGEDEAVVANGKIYVPGGWTQYPPLPNSNLFEYNISTNTWGSLASMPALSAAGISGVYGSKIYVTNPASGYDYAADNYLYAYDTLTNSWSTLASSPICHYGGAGGFINGKLYVAGGSNYVGVTTSELDVYDPSTNSWTTKASMPATIGGSAYGIINNKLYAAGGYNGTSYVNTLYVYDPVTDSWTTQTSMPETNSNAGCSVVNGILYVFGGYNVDSAILSYSLAYNPASPIIIRVPSGAPGNTYTGTLIVSNGTCSSTSYTFSVTVNPAPNAGTITGTSTLSPGSATTLSDGVSDGTWSSSNTAVATVGSTGTVTGVANGTAIISYAVSGSCGPAYATDLVTVSCPGGSGGIITTIAGNGTAAYSGDGGAATAGELNHPGGVVIDGSGNLYIADNYNYRIRKINSAGVISTIAGNGTYGYSGDGGAATAAKLNNPTGVAIDGSGNIYIVDNGNQRIRKVNTAGIISTIVGNGTYGYTGDGGPSTAGELYNPTGITVDLSGNLYIVDNGNNCIRKVNTSGIISTIAGNGTGGYSGDGGPATAGELNYPYGIAIDGSGILYVADDGNQRIRKINNSGVITTIAGNGTYGYSGDGGAATACSLYYPHGVAIDGSGNVYIVDNGDNRIRKINSSGIISTMAGNGTPGYSGDGEAATAGELANPIGVAVDGSGNVYIVDNGNNVIRFVFNGSSVSSIAGMTVLCTGSNTTLSDATTGGTWASSNNAVATIGSTGTITGVSAGTTIISYTTPCGNAIVTVTVNPLPNAGTITGTSSTTVGGTTTLSNGVSGGTWSSSNTAVASVGSTGLVTGVSNGTTIITYAVSNSCGAAYATDVVTVSCGGTAGIITTIAGNGAAGYGGDGGAATSAEFYGAVGVAIDGSGNIYIGDEYNNRIRKINTSGVISTIAGNGTGGGSYGSGGYSGDGGAATDAELNSPAGVAIDASGNVYFADDANNRIRKINTSGIISTIAGNGTSGYSGDGGAATAGELSHPFGVSTDDIGNVYIADFANNRIRKVNTSGIISTIAGNGPGGYSGDGGAATLAALNGPAGVTVDGGGNVYVAEYSNNIIRKINTSGIISTIAGNGTGGYSGDGGAATAAGLNTPVGVAVDGSGNVYIGDALNNRIRKVNLAGIIGTIAGNGTGGFSGDGGVATAGELNIPYGVAIDGSGSIYIADLYNSRIRKVAAGNTVSSITGILSSCAGAATTLTDATSGGSWSSSNTAVAIIGSTGLVTGVAAGTTTISYSTPCSNAMVTVTVNPLPNAGTITGTSSTTVGSTTTLSDGVSGGSWSSSNTAIATVNVSSGLVTAVAVGNTTISYAVSNSCGTAYATKLVTVTAPLGPDPITGTTTVCPGSTTSLSDAITGGTWTSSDSTVATIGISSGTVLGLTAGNTTITYTTSGGYVTTVVTVTSISSISGPSAVCAGQTITLSDAGGGSWSSSAPTIAAVGSSTGIVTGVAGGLSATITYTLGSGCRTTTTITVLPLQPILGPSSVCVGQGINMADSTSGGSWSSGDGTVNVGISTGIVTGLSVGSATISYTTGSGCVATTVLTVNALSAITGPTSVCQGQTIALSDAASGGSWHSSVPTVASVNISTGIVTGAYGGVATTVISYTLGSGCTSTTTVTENPLGLISGPSSVCQSASITLTDAVSGGTWSSGDATVSVVSGTGVVNGLSAGTATISYTTGSGCIATTIITINATSPITGLSSVCQGQNITISDGLGGGTWTSASPTIATITGSTGLLTGVAPGSAVVSYALGSGCITTTTITISIPPANHIFSIIFYGIRFA